ncbi:MAG: isopentenyl-diphosphate Delta-isomerase [Deltaproteobacteria bacterium]|nr:isopentenyl-diphosphate Delta-isomerase [Deltaproteobacteria bacterium]
MAADEIILVDAQDRELGFAPVKACHDGEGRLHRAFSVFILNSRGEVLLQQRSPEKRLWPLYWSNSCCSHPRRGETVEQAAARRLKEELAVSAPLNFLYKFQYQARFGDTGSENELCWVFVGRFDGAVRADPHEIAAWRYVSPDALDRELASEPDRFTPWLKLEWARIRAEHGAMFRGA